MRKIHANYHHKCRKTYPSHLAHFRFKFGNAAGFLGDDMLALSGILELFTIKIPGQQPDIPDDIVSLQFDLLPEPCTSSSIAQV